ncbi:hypothetical protein BDZ45DRAFT_220321 [Acephala macrosclerotiorum]|nr:hypothetical protein BDZ45DRAFT_220321 [Acephala macrosclerotiorum]
MRPMLLFVIFGVVSWSSAASLFDALPRVINRDRPFIKTSVSVSNSLDWIVDSNITHAPKRLSPRGTSACPEDVGAQLFSCNDCGGENSTYVGHCLGLNPGGMPCQCTNVNSTHVLSTVTATQSTQTVVATYALETISSYTELRQSITTTLTASNTATGEVETAAAVVLAGGVSWFLAGFVGDAGVAESILKAPKEADGHPDDNTCPNPELSCSECGGTARMCTTGANVGCACEASTCPSGDQAPKCSDRNCSPDTSNKCTLENAGCDCEPAEECPGTDDPTQLLTCDECGGSVEGSDGVCKGVRRDKNLEPLHDLEYLFD